MAILSGRPAIASIAAGDLIHVSTGGVSKKATGTQVVAFVAANLSGTLGVSVSGNAATATELAGTLATGKLLAGQGTGIPAVVTVGAGLDLTSGTLALEAGAAIADATDGTDVIAQLNALLAFLRSRGDLATP